MPKVQKILIAAHFSVCNGCGQFGRIIFSDGSTSDGAFYRETALEYVAKALREKKLCHEEADVVKGQIRTSSLPSIQENHGIGIIRGELLKHSTMPVDTCPITNTNTSN